MPWQFDSPVTSAVVGALAGFLIALPLKLRWGGRRGPPSIPPEPLPDGRSEESRKLASLVNDFYAITSHVDDQVGEHSERVTEITNSLDTEADSFASTVREAGVLLLSANQQLQRDLQEARSEIQRQREQLEFHRKESVTDPLTGLPNRREFDALAARYCGSFAGSCPATLVLIDIDDFKKFNDRHGHMVGDHVLKFFAQTLVSLFRETDVITRFGGEEFAAILPNTSSLLGAQAAERVREAISRTEYRVGELNLRITASFGICAAIKGESDKEWIVRADAALYGAKHAGRNCCFIHTGTDISIFRNETDVASESAPG